MTTALLLVAALAAPVPIIPLPDLTSMDMGQSVTCRAEGGCIAMTKAVLRAAMEELESRNKSSCLRKGYL